MTDAPRVSERRTMPQSADVPQARLTLFDSICIIVGIIIGAGLYETTPLIAASVPDMASLALIWVLGGVFALVGSLCYAELATAYPAEGGDYVYLTRGFGPRLGFLFAWAQFWIVRPGSIGMMAFVFSRYAQQLVDLGPFALVIYAAATVVAITALNVVGVRAGAWTQNILTVAKVAGLAAVFAIGFLWRAPGADTAAQASMGTTPASANWYLAAILVLFTYGGWNDMAYVAAEVRRPERNILRALLLGTSTVIVIYLVAAAAFVHALGLAGVQQSSAVAADVARLALGDFGAAAISGLVCISALGAVNGMILTGARIYYAGGIEHRLFAPLGVWSHRFGTPLRSLVVQGVVTLAVIVGFGAIDAGTDGFQRMVDFATAVFWGFLFLSGVALFRLRSREGGRPGHFRVPFYPFTPLVFCAGCLFLLYSSARYAWDHRSIEAGAAFILLALGGALSFLPFDRRLAGDGH